MYRKLFNAVMILMLLLGLTASAVVAKPPEQSRQPVPIGAMWPAGKHLVEPRQEVVASALKEEGKLALDASDAEVQAAVDQYYAEFRKKSSEYVNPEMEYRAFNHEQESGSALQAPAAVTPVSVKVFGLAVDFGGVNEYVPYSRPNTAGDDCVVAPTSETYTGPMVGEVPAPGARDNNTVWYGDKVLDPNFYSELIFGYTGAGEIRGDLIDPRDGTNGIDLTGYTVQDYYDHIAGPGNVILEGQMQGWVTVPHSEAWYGAPLCIKTSTGLIVDDDSGGSVPVNRLVTDALDVFMAQHPGYYSDQGANAFWPQFDQDGDGWLDTLWIIHAGMGEEAGGGAQGDLSIWSHSSALNGYQVYEGNPATDLDDVWAGPYTIQPEHADLGVLVEEFGHNFFGLPDLYTTDAENSIGFWSEMAAGSWGGPLGGSIPVGMPLWFLMNAWCGIDWCNWQEPMAVQPYDDEASTYILDQLDQAEGSTYGGMGVKGVRISLPQLEDTVTNRAGTGKAAFTGVSAANNSQKLVRSGLDLTSQTEFSFRSYWDIENQWDYGFVELKLSSETTWTILQDKDNKFTNSNPYGNNEGWGLTGTGGPFKLRFDIPAKFQVAGVDLRLRYKTDPYTFGKGWWVDDFMVGTTLVDNFETATEPSTFPGWTNDTVPWIVVPYLKYYTQYYLVEWRSHTKYDEQVKTAYVSTYYDDDEWQVERVPYNIPGALVYYRNTKYGNAYDQRGYYADPLSYGPKNKLLLVDMNYDGMRLIDKNGDWTGYILNNRAASYDAALTLQPSQAFEFSGVNGVPIAGPFKFASEAPVTQFNDALGYYAGLYFGAPCTPGYVCYANRDGSVVIPARGKYSTRITDFLGNPLYDLYGAGFAPSWLGSGNPGDDMMQYGVNIRLLDKSPDDSQALLEVYNYSVDFSTTAEVTLPTPYQPVITYTTEVENVGTEDATNVKVMWTLDDNLTFMDSDCPVIEETVAPASPEGFVKVCLIPSLLAGETQTVTLTARVDNVAFETYTRLEMHDGQIMRGPFWSWDEISGYAQLFLPFTVK